MIETKQSPDVNILLSGKGTDKAKNNFPKLKSYLKEKAPNGTEVDLVGGGPAGSETLKFYYRGDTKPITYKDDAGKSVECTYDDAIAWWHAKNRPTDSPTSNPDRDKEITELKLSLQTSEKNLATNTQTHVVKSRILQGLIVMLFVLMIIAASWIGSLTSEMNKLIQANETLSTRTATQKSTIDRLTQLPQPQTFGKNEFLGLVAGADTDSQNHVLVGKVTQAPLLVTGHDLELTWIYQGNTYTVKNHPFEYGIVLIPKGATIQLVNLRGPGMKVYVSPGLMSGITYLLGHSPGFIEDHSGIAWPTTSG